jgi:hypothetical protein
VNVVSDVSARSVRPRYVAALVVALLAVGGFFVARDVAHAVGSGYTRQWNQQQARLIALTQQIATPPGLEAVQTYGHLTCGPALSATELRCWTSTRSPRLALAELQHSVGQVGLAAEPMNCESGTPVGAKPPTTQQDCSFDVDRDGWTTEITATKRNGRPTLVIAAVVV